MSNDDAPRSHAEETDSTKLGETVGQADRSGDVFPPDEPLAVDDPNIRADGSIARDDVATRDAREQPEVGEPGARGGDGVGHDLLEPSDDPDVLDDEQQLIGAVGDDADTAAEVVAVDVTDDAPH